MEKFELKVDVNTPYIKVIRFIGVFLLGFFVGALLLKFKYGNSFDWMNAFIGIGCSLSFTFFPGAAKKQSLTINGKGIFLHSYTYHWGTKKEVRWEKVTAIGVKKNTIEFRNTIGSSEKIKLPLHTKRQLSKLKAYLKQLTEVKEIEYLS